MKIEVINTQTDDLITFLLKLGKSLKRKAILYPCEDNNVLSISNNRDELKENFLTCLPNTDLLKQLLTKEGFHILTNRMGYITPNSYIIHSMEEANDISGKINYPCIIKPSLKTFEWNRTTTLKAFKINKREQLISVLHKFFNYSNCFIIQEWIKGSDENYFTFNCYFDKNSNPISSIVTKKIRQWPPQTGQASSAQIVKNLKIKEQCMSFFNSLDFKGFGYLEIKYDASNNHYYFIEANVGRPTGRAATADMYGIPLIYSMYADLLNLPIPSTSQYAKGNLKWIHIRRDIHSSFYYWRSGSLSMKEWWASLKGPKYFPILDLKDPWPFVMDIWRSVRLSFSKKERNKRSFKIYQN